MNEYSVRGNNKIIRGGGFSWGIMCVLGGRGGVCWVAE